MIEPDEEISSYSLMDLCSVGLVWVSTAGLELACKGKTVVVAAGNRVAGTSFVHTVPPTPTSYEDMLDSLLGLAPGAVSAEIKRLALRFAYCLFFRHPHPVPPGPDAGRPHGRAGLQLARRSGARPRRRAGPLLRASCSTASPCVRRRPRPIGRADTEVEDAYLKPFGKPRLTVLAFAEELIADGGLLEAWGETFDGRYDVTLLIHTPAEMTPTPCRGRDPRPASIATTAPTSSRCELDADMIASVDAVFSRFGIAAGSRRAPALYDAARSQTWPRPHDESHGHGRCHLLQLRVAACPSRSGASSSSRSPTSS